MESAVAFMLETGNTTLIPVIQSFQAEIALMQGPIATAGQWAARLDPVPPLRPIHALFSPHLTLVKVWLAQDTATSRQQATDLLARLRAFLEATHNKRFLMEVLALQALLRDGQGERQIALERLEQAVALAQPGGFIRLFVDLGPPMARLLEQLRRQGVAPRYIGQILAAFGTEDQGRKTDVETPSVVRLLSSSLIEPLTPRESEVLALLGRHLTNKEIAAELVISPLTVKTHTLNLYRKLDVRRRQEAVIKARELGLL
jgi:LuxR family maltose regulon positive regulatory protein